METENKQEQSDLDIILTKMQKYCAYQERCHFEVRLKLSKFEISGHEAGVIITKLIESGYLNEERYAKVYAGGKFRVKKWGRNKIINRLKSKDVSMYCINKGLEEIEMDDYLETLKYLMQKRISQSKEKNSYLLKSKVSIYLTNKGYEPHLIWTELNKIKL